MAKFRTLEVQGFRAFCRKQEMSFESNLAVLWGPNSQGKTSLCEALEFLLTGTTVRRDLTAGSQDEFAGALRNVHVGEDDEVYVQATIEASDGTRHVIRRVLAKDFEKRAPCESRLEVDGKAATQDAIRALGIVLSQPPMQAPILLQHTLAYLFSAKPGDRSAYFKALLEVNDLDDVRRELQNAIATFAVPSYPLRAHLDRLKDVPVVVAILKVQFRNMPDVATVRAGLEKAAGALLRDAAIPRSGTDEGTELDRLRRSLAERQRAAFPVAQLKFPSMPERAFDAVDTTAVDGLRAADSAVEKEVERFGTLYRELLRIHPADTTTPAVDCPACGTTEALTSARLQALQQRLRETDEYHRALTTARAWLTKTRSGVAAEAKSIRALRLVAAAAGRKKHSFGVRALLDLIGEKYRPQITDWVRSIRLIGTNRRRLAIGAANVLACLPDEAKLGSASFASFRLAATEFLRLHKVTQASLDDGQKVATVLREAANKVVSEKTSTVGWQDVLDLHADATALSEHLRHRHAHEALGKEHDRALKDFDEAKDGILSSKFLSLSTEMKRWWEFLRPESLTGFESVGMRVGATRTVDFKVALYTDETQKTKTIRDAIAVFSASQLHCLGVAAFLARSIRDGSGFIVLDDPVLSSDHEHRSGFVNQVVEELNTAGLQVLLLTQEQRLRDDIGVRYDHLKPELFRIELLAPLEGTIVTKTSDGIAEKLSRIRILLKVSDDVTRKQVAGELRDVAERFCKYVLARHYGPPKSPSDFDGMVLSALVELMDTEKIFKRPDHKGKLALLRRWTNPGNHDAPIPSTSDMKAVLGDLDKFVKEYLS